ncbi:MAG TPA: hypothetical protein VHM01_23535 [Alphaproteobacteria bacterium]|nr:hypothetical protein [Alphaproteobacteria bacterium]
MTGLSLSSRHAAAGSAAIWRLLAALVAVGGSTALLLYFHDRFWWGPDEGAYAHVAQRILHGEVLNRDVQDMHAGYINFANALAFRLFGEDLLSLRYPPVVLGIVQAYLIFRTVEPRGAFAAAAAALALTSLSFIQFLNPTANWYALFLAVVVTWMLARVDRTRPLVIETIGFLLVTTFLFRQLTGVIVAIGAVAWLLLDMQRRDRAPPGRLAPALFALMAFGLLLHLLRKNDVIDWLLFGVCPLAILARAGLSVRIDDKRVLSLVARLLIGGAVGLLPLVFYHLWHGSLLSWLDDMVGGALALSDMPFTRRPLYAAMALLSLQQVLTFETLARVLNGLLWLSLLAIPTVNGIAALRATGNQSAPHPLLFMAAFHALVSTFHQLPLYLMTSSGLSLAALVWSAVALGPRWRVAAMAGAGALAVIAVHYQAAEPIRMVSDSIAGTRGDRPVDSTLPRVSLKIDPSELRDHAALSALIERETPADAAILAVPFDPQLYFISGRRNPARFYNTAIGIRDEASLAATLDVLERDPPRLLFHRADDKYNTDWSRRLVAALLPHYEKFDRVGELDVYRRR